LLGFRFGLSAEGALSGSRERREGEIT
jgi:hypothetical protein